MPQVQAPIVANAVAGGAMVKTVCTNSTSAAGSKDPVDVATFAAHRDIIPAANLRAEEICKHLLPNGKPQGRAWVVKSWEGEPGQSLKITVVGAETGHWKDMRAGGGAGSNLIEVWSHAKHVTLDQAAVEVAVWLADQGMVFTPVNDAAVEPPGQRPKVAETHTTGSPVAAEITPTVESVVDVTAATAVVPMAEAVVDLVEEGAAAPMAEQVVVPVGDVEAEAAITPTTEQPLHSFQLAIIGTSDDGTRRKNSTRVVSKEFAGRSVNITEPLTATEMAEYDQKVRRLKKIEASWFEGCRILQEIKDRHLYRHHYPTFDAFCHHELDMGKANANRRLQTARVAERLATNVANPELEGHVRPLLRLGDQAEQITAFQQAVTRAKVENKPLTAAFVERAVREIENSHRYEKVAVSSATKGAVIKQIRSALTRDLEKLSLDQLEAFQTACLEFKEHWLAEVEPAEGRGVPVDVTAQDGAASDLKPSKI